MVRSLHVFNTSFDRSVILTITESEYSSFDGKMIKIKAAIALKEVIAAFIRLK